MITISNTTTPKKATGPCTKATEPNLPIWSAAIWWGLALLAVFGLILVTTGDMEGAILTLAAVGAFATRAFVGAIKRVGPDHRWEAGTLIAITLITGALIVYLATVATPLGGGLVILATASMAQFFFLAIGQSRNKESRHGGRLVFPLIGHTSILVGGGVLLWNQGAFTPGVALAYTCGFTMLAFHAYWSACHQDPTGRAKEWEMVMLVGVLSGVLAAATHYLVLADHIGPSALSMSLALAAVTIAAAILGRPPRAPRPVRSTGDIATAVVAHGIAGIAFVNVLFLAYALVAGWSVRVLLAVLLLWTFMVVFLEYRSVMHLRKNLREGTLELKPTEFPEPRDPITVIVPAANEAEVLPQSMQENLKIDYPLRFVILPAEKSEDDTVEIAKRIADKHPERVRVLVGRTGSKAEDLNEAWKDVDTSNVLIMDADETIDADSLARGLWVLKRDPEVGVVQGRKVSRDPEGDAMNRFACCERRYSTGVDTLLHAQKMGSSHFGGSGALLRREVPPEVGGWTTFSMVEDIEFTLRVHLDTSWRIHYEPTMVVRESSLQSMRELFRQRTRWGRGWIQCVTAYMPRLWARRKHLGARRTIGLTWLLLMCVSALWMTLLPAALLLRVTGVQLVLPLQIALVLVILFLPARIVSYGYSSVNDPVIPIKRTPRRFFENLFHAYSWIPIGWAIQLHALYLEFSKAPRVWYVTGKRADKRPPTTAVTTPGPSPTPGPVHGGSSSHSRPQASLGPPAATGVGASRPHGVPRPPGAHEASSRSPPYSDLER